MSSSTRASRNKRQASLEELWNPKRGKKDKADMDDKPEEGGRNQCGDDLQKESNASAVTRSIRSAKVNKSPDSKLTNFGPPGVNTNDGATSSTQSRSSNKGDNSNDGVLDSNSDPKIDNEITTPSRSPNIVNEITHASSSSNSGNEITYPSSSSGRGNEITHAINSSARGHERSPTSSSKGLSSINNENTKSYPLSSNNEGAAGGSSNPSSPMQKDDAEEPSFPSRNSEGFDASPTVIADTPPSPISVSSTKSDASKGVSIDTLKRSPECYGGKKYPSEQLRDMPNHVVMFDPRTLCTDRPPKPHPAKFEDKWEDDFVKMPCSDRNIYPVKGTNESRWKLIKNVLEMPIQDVGVFETVILSYNSRYQGKWNFYGLNGYLMEKDPQEEKAIFDLIEKIAKLALRLPELCTKPVPLLKSQKLKSLTLSQEQAACLLANAFFCTFPRRNAKGKECEYSTYPSINFNTLFQGSRRGVDDLQCEKLNCIFHYFKRVTDKMPTGTLTFRRQLIKNPVEWKKSLAKLCDLHVSSTGTIEDDGRGMLQVDFANKLLGGGVLGHGAVQEEIRFLMCPEMILGRLFTEVLAANESVIMTGCECYSSYKGYSRSFKYTGNYTDTIERDAWGRRFTSVVAIDALVFNSFGTQFEEHNISRELNKAYCGFMSPDKECKPTVATGNWGCGAFGGDKQLKALLQLLAASEAKRDVCYFTFGDSDLVEELGAVHKQLKDSGYSIADIMKTIRNYNQYLQTHKRNRLRFFSYILEPPGSTSPRVVVDIDSDSQEFCASIGFDRGSTGGRSPDYKASTP